MAHAWGNRYSPIIDNWAIQGDPDMNILQTIRLLALLAFVAASTVVIINMITTEALELRALTQVGLYRA